MSRALFVVIHSQGNWWVDVEGKAHGPYGTRQEAGEEAIQLARYAVHMGRGSEVLVPDDAGRHHVIWTSDGSEQRPSAPRSAAE